MERNYVIDSKLYRLEVLTEQMSTGELFYFLRGVQDTSDIVRVAYEELPEEYVPHTTHLPAGTVVCEHYSTKVLKEDLDIDLQFYNYSVPHDKDGNLISNGHFYRTMGGTMFAIKENKIIPQIVGNVDLVHNIEGAEKVDEMAYSMVTGKKLTEPDSYMYTDTIELFGNKDEFVESSYSGDLLPEYLDNEYAEFCGTIVFRSDIRNGMCDEYFICEECDEIHHVDFMENIGGDKVCSDCIEDHYIYSEIMQEYIHESEVCYVGNDAMSYEYRSDNYYQCESCGEWANDDNIIETEDGYYLCDDCADDYRIGNEYWYRDNFIHDYHPDIDLEFYGDGPKYLGCEWEIQGGGEDDRKARKLFGDNKYFYCSHDGSLDEGFECITMPCSPKVLLEDINWERLVGAVLGEGYDDPDGAGFHIHISREHFNDRSAIGKLVRFFYKYYDELVEFANRDEDDATHWADATDCDGDTTFYRSYEKAMEKRYSAVNVQNSHTVEIRLFNSSYDSRDIRSYIQFTDIISDLANGMWADMTWDNIKVLANERGYDDLTSRLDEMCL
jgi:hypothetical protein